MPVIDTWNLLVDADDVLRGQGADPSIIRVRRPRLYEIAVQALEEGFPLVHPVVQMERYKVDLFLHHQINLSREGNLKGELLAEKLVKAKEIVVILCTIGSQLEERVEQVMADEVVHGLALYGVGSAAVEAWQMLPASILKRKLPNAAGSRPYRSAPVCWAGTWQKVRRSSFPCWMPDRLAFD